MAPSFFSFGCFRKTPSHPYISSPYPEYAPLIAEKDPSLSPVPALPPHLHREVPAGHVAIRSPSTSYTHRATCTTSYLSTKPLPVTPPPPPRSSRRQKGQGERKERNRGPEKRTKSEAPHISFDSSITNLPDRPALVSKFAVPPSPHPKDMITLSFGPQDASPIEQHDIILPPSPNPPVSYPLRAPSPSHFPLPEPLHPPALPRDHQHYQQQQQQQQHDSREVPLLISPSARDIDRPHPLPNAIHQSCKSPTVDSTLDDIYANYASYAFTVSGAAQERHRQQQQQQQQQYKPRQQTPSNHHHHNHNHQQEPIPPNVQKFAHAQHQLAMHHNLSGPFPPPPPPAPAPLPLPLPLSSCPPLTPTTSTSPSSSFSSSSSQYSNHDDGSFTAYTSGSGGSGGGGGSSGGGGGSSSSSLSSSLSPTSSSSSPSSSSPRSERSTGASTVTETETAKSFDSVYPEAAAVPSPLHVRRGKGGITTAATTAAAAAVDDGGGIPWRLGVGRVMV